MTKMLKLLALGALAVFAFAALPAGVSASTMTATCSAVPCVGIIESTGTSQLTQDSGLGIVCGKETGTVTQAASPSTTVSVTLTFDECKELFGAECNNEGAGTGKIVTNTVTGDLITVTANNKATAGILLTGIDYTFKCPAIGLERTVTGNVIGTFEDSPEMCGVARTHHTTNFGQVTTGVQSDLTYTGKAFDLTSGPHMAHTTTTSLRGTTHINYQEGKTVTINC